LFGHALRGREKGRNYPSAGALYPVETYILLASSEDMLSGVFHYNPTSHTLEKLWNFSGPIDLAEIVGGPEKFGVSALIVLTSVWARSAMKYGDYAYVLSLLEAGHMSENILLVGSALSCSMRPIVAFDEEQIARLLDLDESEEQIIQTVMIGKSGDTARE
jgi:SagB-type dehydrogenase family enzyme